MSSTGAEPTAVLVGHHPIGARLPGPDVVRAVAILGVIVMNYHGYLILRGGSRGGSALADVFDPWTGPLSTRFAAAFVLVAGVGVTLLSASSVGDPDRMRTIRWRLASRGLVLYVFGLGFDIIWRGAILPYYGAMFAVAAVIVTWRSRWILLLGVTAATSAWVIRGWQDERSLDGRSTIGISDPTGPSVRALVFDVGVNGTHPLLPWLLFFCVGIVVGRAMLDPALAAAWRPAVIGIGIVLAAAAMMTHTATAGTSTDPGTRLRWSVDPFDRGILYSASALGTALMAFGVITWLADRYDGTVVVDALARIGTMSLSIYIAHALVFNLLVDWWGWVEPGGVTTSLVFSVAVWVVAALAALAYRRRFDRGPAESVYRAITM